MHLTQKLQGKVRCQVVDSVTREVLRDYGWQNNLILNQGLNQLCLLTASNVVGALTYAVAGSGSTPVKDLGGATNAAQIGTTVTLSGGAFTFTNTGVDAGKVIKWVSGEEAMVITVTNPTTVEVDRSQTVLAGAFNVYRTNQTGLTAELKRSSSYLQGSGYCGSTQNPRNVMMHRRTYEFTAESGPVTYRELGFSYTPSSGANIFSRILLDTPVSLLATNQLRVTYDLTVTYSPSNAFITDFPITGWPVAPSTNVTGSCFIVNLQSANIGVNGQPPGILYPENIGLELSSNNSLVLATTNGSILPLNEPAATPDGGLSFATSTPYTLTQLGNHVDISGPTFSAYITNSFTRVKTWVVTPSLTGSNRTDFRLIMVAGHFVTQFQNYYIPVLVFLFDQNQTKDNVHRLTVNVRWTFSRVLS